MAQKNCKHQGFAFAKSGYKDVHIICDYTGEIHKKAYCRDCIYYEPREKNPTADVQEVKHGKWVQSEQNKCRCSNCGAKMDKE